MHVATTHHASSLITNGTTTYWVGSETLEGLQFEGREVNTLAHNGNQVNTVMPGYVCQHEFPGDGSHSWDRRQTGTPICGRATEETPREVESGWH